MTENSWKKFFAPVLKLKVVCHKCRACIHVCPTRALTWGVGEIIVDLKKCAEVWLKECECLRCAAECHQGAILLEEYEIKGRDIRKVIVE